jgi:hypothetical protein
MTFIALLMEIAAGSARNGVQNRPAQSVFLERIRSSDGVPFITYHCRDVLRELENNRDKSNEAGTVNVRIHHSINKLGANTNG